MPRKETKTTAKASPRRKKTNVVTESTFTRESTGTQIHKPVIGIGTWIALVLFAGLVTFAIFLNKKEETAVEATPTSGTVPLFPATEGTPSSIEVKPAEGEAVRVLRNEENVWVLELPFETEVDPGLSEAAATQVSALQEISTVQGDLADFGLENPAFVITVGFASGKTHTLEIGDMTPSNRGYYVRVDEDRLVVVAVSGLDALLQLQFSPPYLNTPTPTATTPPPTETPTPAPPTETPAASVTPTP